jgi:hypothetical protein
MAGQLSSFVQKFYSLWQAGNDARLNIECHAGEAQIHLQLSLHQPPHNWFGWVVSDLDFTKYKALMAELLWILLADGGGF